MEASLETAELPESSDTHSSPHPPSSPELHPTQGSPFLTIVAPPEMANPDHATLVPPPPAEQATVEQSVVDQLPPTPIDEAEPPPSQPPPEAAPAASPAFEAVPTEKLASPSPLPEDVAVEVSPEVAASAPSPSPSPSPQIVGVSPEDAPQPPSPPRTPPATTPHASTDPSTAEAIAMASQEEAARPPPALESMDADSRTAPAPALLTPPMESGPEGLLVPQQPRPPSPQMALPLCENLEPAQPPQPSHPAECTNASRDATVDEAVEGTSETAAGSLLAPKATDRDMDITPGVLPTLEIGSGEILSQQQPQQPCQEMAPQRGGNSKSAQPLQPPPPAETTYGSNAVANVVSAVASEEATAVLEFGAERSSQGPEQTSTSPRMEAEPCSPEMAPPGFEDFKSQWLPPPTSTPLVESTHNPLGTTLDAATESPSTLETMDEGRLQQPLPGSCSPMIEAAPCSPDMPPPGFENCKSSWLPLPTLPPIAKTTYTLQDVASTKPVPFLEKACSVPALEATDVETDTQRCQLPPLESGTGSVLQGPPPRSPSPTMQVTPCSPDTAPPGFENIKLTQLQLSSPPLVQTAHILQASAANEAMHMHVASEETSQSSSALKAMDLDMDAILAVTSPLESEAGKSLPPEPPLAPSHVAKLAACSLGMVPSGSENVESSQLLPPPAVVLPLAETPDALADAETKTVTIKEVCHTLPLTGATEEANGSILPPALENGCEGPLPHLEPQAPSAAVHAAPTSPEIAPTSFENSESSQQTSPCLDETIDPSTHASATMPAIVKSGKTSLPLFPLQATDTDMESATPQQLPLKSEERSLPQPEQHPSSLSVKDTTCSPEAAPPGYENLDSLEQLPPPPSLNTKFEMGQMVCGCCRQLLAYPRGAVHVQCFGCWTINLVLEEHQVGKVHCGQCETFLMYPFGAPAVKCSYCHFVTEISERNVRPRITVEQSVSPHPEEECNIRPQISMEQSVSPHPQEVANQT